MVPSGDRPISPASSLISPYGGSLKNLLVSESRANEIKASAGGYASQTLDKKILCDLELLAQGGFSPLTTFMGKQDFERVQSDMRLADGTFWPLPVALPVDASVGVQVGQPLALRDVYGNLLALMQVEDVFEASRFDVMDNNQGNNDNCGYVSGPLEVIRTPPHFDFTSLRLSPAHVRQEFDRRGWHQATAFYTGKIIYRPVEEAIRMAMGRESGELLIHPAVGVATPGDVEHYTRVRCHKAVFEEAFRRDRAMLALVPASTEKPGLRGLYLQAIVSRNYGCKRLIVNPGEFFTDISKAFAGNAIANASVDCHNATGVELKFLPEVAFVPDTDRFFEADQLPDGVKNVRRMTDVNDVSVLSAGEAFPDWFVRPGVAEILAESHPPRHRQGLTIWFTGLSGSGKSTVAHALVERLAEFGRNVAFLDGDEIRTHLSRGLGFTREDRDTNINRVGYVAGLVAAQGGTTICSVISPYRATRGNARRASKGRFVEIYCCTPIEVCESRDVKGLYARARAASAEGKGMGFTGIDDPYEEPVNPEVTLDTSKSGVEKCVDVIIEKLQQLGFIRKS
ncbi:MAG: adenylyl-sulfate kinase [Isosphaeraceae bacterium]